MQSPKKTRNISIKTVSTADARRTALAVLNQLDQNKQTLDTILHRTFNDGCILSKPDRALANTLIYGVVRWRNQIDWIIGQFSNVPQKKIEPAILNILRLAIFQLLHLTKIPESAAVNTAVNIAKEHAERWTVRYVNGVLRNVTRNFGTLSFPAVQTDPLAAIATTHAFPEWLISRWMNRLGVDATQDLCRHMNTIPPITLRTNTLKTSRKQLFRTLIPHVHSLSECRYSTNGLMVTRPKVAINVLDSFQKGWFQVQDEAAQLVSELLDVQPGQTVLDACAGLGGKTAHLGQIMQNEGTILALDKDTSKLTALEADMNRLGITIVRPSAHDLQYPLHPGQFPFFDRILLDAPCSGLGVIRRNPDIKWSVQAHDLVRYQQRQIRFLDTVCPLLKPGGILVYAVCSMEPEEGEAVVDTFLNQHPEFTVLSFPKRHPFLGPWFKNNRYHFQTSPYQHVIDGFFAVRLRRSL